MGGNKEFNGMDLELWGKIQDEFSKEMRLSIYLIDLEANEISISGKIPFFCEMLKKHSNICKKCWLKNLPKAIENNIESYECPSNLGNIMVPVRVSGNVIGAVIAGPIKYESKPVDLKEISEISNIDEHELNDYYKKIETVRKERFDHFVSLLNILAKTMPEICQQRYYYEKRLSEVLVLQKIIQMVNSTLNLEEVLNYIMNFMVTALNANDCTVFVNTEEGEKRYTLGKGIEMIEVEKAVSKRAVERREAIIINDVNRSLGINVDKRYNAVIALPLKVKNEIIGTINIYDNSAAKIKRNDIDFLGIIADQAAIAVSNAQQYEEIKELAVVDKLTNVYNRRYFMELLEKNVEEEYINSENPISLILIDIDDFGKYNNTYGHPKGDELLIEMGKILKANVRPMDLVGRYGGEEFIVMMPKAKSHTAAEVAKRLKEAVETTKFFGRETQPNGRVTISLGAVTCMDHVNVRELVQETDKALYKAKTTGKNKVVQMIIIKKNLKAEI